MVVLHVIAGLVNGGAESQLYQFVINDSANEHHVFSLTDSGYYGQDISKAGINLIQAQMPRGILTISGIKKLFLYVKKTKPDVIQTWMYHGDLVGGVVGRLAGCSNIVWGIHHTSLEKHNTSLSVRTIVKLCAPLSGFVPRSILCCAQSTLEIHKRAGYDSEKLKVAYNGYDENRFYYSSAKRAEFRHSFGIEESEFIIGMVGRWNHLKDHANLFRALELLSPSHNTRWRCLMVGPDIDESNDELTKLVNCSSFSNDHFLLLGPRKDIETIMSSIDVLVLPSASEAFPNVVAEAMLSERPCIVTDVGDASTIVGDCGWVVPPKDPVSFSVALNDAFTEFTLNRSWKARGSESRKRIIQNFGLSKMIDTYMAAWRLGC